MSFRTALSQSNVLPFAALGAAGWLGLTALQVVGTMQPLWGGESVGQTAVTGLVGAIVIAVSVGLLVALLGELGERRPGPQTWPPEE
ncbi:hypothetical protein SAMN04487948_104132 [Halogranum amylolyticum]|uniref:Uncharacterized protein n=1 Tax=Halogranum amylolyticum TaxID=660520 RepID=A0A1H8RN72_9EURY|nr:hypothetical protein [Halogranum amylolyticum]SEO67815.1 hypothetical protein SAMN04487948_104132 [Halogranum amylolyticum]